LKKKKKKQEPIFSTLEEIRINKTEKIFEQEIIPCEMKDAEETTKFFQSETIVVAPLEPSQANSSLTADSLPSEQEEISPASEKAEEITIPSLLEPPPVVIPEPSAKTLLSPVVSLSDGHEIISPGGKEAQGIAISCEPEPAVALPSPPGPTILLTANTSLPDFSFVFISPGSLIMGSPETELGRSDDELPHEVSITHGFFLQTTPVTQGQWKAVMGNNFSQFSPNGDDHPVESVSWYDCQKFIERLNSSGEHTYRLPTEAEWEYACRAGKFSSCSEGEIIELFCDQDPSLDAVGWYCGNSDRVTHPVAQKKPNPWGLYDLHGNVLEWCQDWYGTYPATPQTDPTGPITGPGRVIRGGSWFSNAKSCRSAARFFWSPNAKSDFIGFRLLREQKDNSH
jgi:formylglycine-generating enzyme required for sulfatase activity